jgi:hypothetical protein
MFLFDVYSFMAENTLAVNVARRLAFTIRMVVQEQSFSEMDVFIAMTWVRHDSPFYPSIHCPLPLAGMA